MIIMLQMFVAQNVIIVAVICFMIVMSNFVFLHLKYVSIPNWLIKIVSGKFFITSWR